MAMKWTVKVRPEVWVDARFLALERRLKSRYEALGRLVEFWGEAQSHWVKGQGIPDAIYKLIDHDGVLIESGFVKTTDGCFYARGDEEHFAWLRYQKERGRLSVESRTKKYGTSAIISNNGGQDETERTTMRLAMNHDATCDEPRCDLARTKNPTEPSTLPNQELELELEQELELEGKGDWGETGPPMSGLPSPVGEGLVLLSKKRSGKTNPNQDDVEIARLWGEWAKTVSSTVRPTPAWAKTVNQLVRIDKLTHDGIAAMLDYVSRSSFWAPNAISLPGLRSKSRNGLMKWENILASMKRDDAERRRFYDESPEGQRSARVIADLRDCLSDADQ